MPNLKRTPGCPCCKCLIYKTGFASSAVLDDWTVTGTGAVVSSALQITTAAATAILDTPHPQYPYPPRVAARVKGGTGAELRLILSWSGTAGIIVELRPGDGCGQLDILQKTGGGESLLSGSHTIPGATVDAWHTVTACYDPRSDIITARVHTADGRYSVFSATITGHVDGQYAGLGTGPTHSGTAYFDDFRWDRLWYYGDGEQDDWATDFYYYEQNQVTECAKCEAIGCRWIDASFASADDLCEWEGATVDWSISSNLLGTDGAGAYYSENSIILHRAAYPWDARTGAIPGNVLGVVSQTETPWTFDEVDHYHRILLTITFSAAAGSTFLGIICATDDQNYTAAQVTVGDAGTDKCGSIKLIQVVSGSATDISDPHIVRGLVSGTTWILQLNYVDGYVIAQIGNHAYGLVQYGAQLRAETSYGPYVGLGATGGAVSVSEFEAGCRQIVEDCGLDSGMFEYDTTQWQTCVWTKLAGTWPTRDANDQLLVDADVSLLFNNPVPVPYRTAHRAVLTGAIDSEAPDDTAVSLIFGSDSSGTDYYQAEVLFSSAGNTLTLYRVNSGTPTLLSQVATAIPSPFVLTACCAGAKVYAAVTSGGSTEANGYAYGGYCGITADVQAGHVSGDLLLATFATYRIHAGLNDWDEFWVATCQGCGPQPTCSGCETGQTARQYQITVVGFDAEKCTGGFCNINRTVIADTTGCLARFDYEPDPQPTCELKLSGSLTTVTLEVIVYSIFFTEISGTLYLVGQVDLERPGFASQTIIQYQFSKALPDPFDCEDMYMEEIPLIGIVNSILGTPPPDWPCWPGYDEWLAFFLGTDPGTDAVKMYVSSL